MSFIKILIYNKGNMHYEIIESVLLNYHRIIGVNSNIPHQIYLDVNKKNNSFIKYIKNKYPEVDVNTTEKYTVHFSINCTIYPDMISRLHTDGKHFYISHRVNKKLLELPNVFYLTPLCNDNNKYFIPTHLPKVEKIQSDIPIYCVQGNIASFRRNYSLLTEILKHDYDYDFKIKLIGRGKLPKMLEPYKDKIILKNNLNFMDYHNEFRDVYCILPLITRKSHGSYYMKKLTSSISYGLGYDLNFLIDEYLQNIYNVPKAFVFQDINNIVQVFTNSLQNFYDKPLKM